MKNLHEKKQDLLLDALSCIDEDILARGLALRDGMTPAAAKASSTKAPGKGGDVTPYLLDLTPPPKPPKQNPWRVMAVVAAACLLLCVIPLSMWMVGSVSKDEAAGETVDGTLDGQEGILDGDQYTGDMAPEDSPGVSPDAPIDSTPSEGTAGEPEIEEPGDTPVGTGEPMEEATEAPPEDVIESVSESPTEEPQPYHSPEPIVWDTKTNQNREIHKTALVLRQTYTYDSPHTHSAINAYYAYHAAVHTYTENDDGFNNFLKNTVSAEDQLVLDLFAQYYGSGYLADYGSHFLLFQREFVDARFVNEINSYGNTDYTLEYCLGSINILIEYTLPHRNVDLRFTLTQNQLLAGQELTAFTDRVASSFAKVGLDAANITAVRRFSIGDEGVVILDGQFYTNDWGYGTTFYCYQYDGVWYMAPEHMDDDASVDFAMSILEGTFSLVDGRITVEGVVTEIRDDVAFLDTDIAFHLGSYNCAVGETIRVDLYKYGIELYKYHPDESRETVTFYRSLGIWVTAQ